MRHTVPAAPLDRRKLLLSSGRLSVSLCEVGCRASGLQELAFNVKMLRPYKTEFVGLIAQLK